MITSSREVVIYFLLRNRKHDQENKLLFRKHSCIGSSFINATDVNRWLRRLQGKRYKNEVAHLPPHFQ